MHKKNFSLKYGTFSQENATASLQKAFNLTRNSRRFVVLALWDMCSNFYIARAMIGRKKQMALKKKNTPAWIWRQNNFLFSRFRCARFENG